MTSEQGGCRICAAGVWWCIYLRLRFAGGRWTQRCTSPHGRTSTQHQRFQGSTCSVHCDVIIPWISTANGTRSAPTSILDHLTHHMDNPNLNGIVCRSVLFYTHELSFGNISIIFLYHIIAIFSSQIYTRHLQFFTILHNLCLHTEVKQYEKAIWM